MTDDRYETWDASYVLGALSPTERREYEAHLAGCARCTAAVGELAGMPGMLAKVPADVALGGTAAPEPVPDTLLPRLAAAAARERRRRRVLVAAGGLVAAACVVAAVIFGVTRTGGGTPAAAVTATMQPVRPVDVVATLRLTAEQFGTRVDVRCEYDGPAPTAAVSGTTEPPTVYALYAIDRAGGTYKVVDWTSEPGREATPTGTTQLSESDIARLELRMGDVVLLQYSPR